MTMRDLTRMGKVPRVRKRRRHRAIRMQCRIPAAVVEVQVRIDDDIDLFRPNTLPPPAMPAAAPGSDGSPASSEIVYSRYPSRSVPYASPSAQSSSSAPSSIRFSSSAGARFDHSVFGTTPNIAPPSSRVGPIGTQCDLEISESKPPAHEVGISPVEQRGCKAAPLLSRRISSLKPVATVALPLTQNRLPAMREVDRWYWPGG